MQIASVQGAEGPLNSNSNENEKNHSKMIKKCKSAQAFKKLSKNPKKR